MECSADRNVFKHQQAVGNQEECACDAGGIST